MASDGKLAGSYLGRPYTVQTLSRYKLSNLNYLRCQQNCYIASVDMGKSVILLVAEFLES